MHLDRPMEPPDRYDVFISYSRRDQACAAQLRARLQEAGKACWLDACDLSHGEHWWPAVQDAIARSACVVCLVSPAFKASPHCAAEAEQALALRKKIIQVLWGDSLPPVSLAHINAITHDDGASFQTTACLVVAAVERDADYHRCRRDLLGRADEWERKGRRASLLLRGLDLTEAKHLHLRCRADGLATSRQCAYLAAGLAAQRRGRLCRAAIAAVMLLQAALTTASFTRAGQMVPAAQHQR